MAIEEAAYTLIQKDHAFELRDYAPHLLAETIVAGDLEGAGNKALPGSFDTSPATTGQASRWR